MPRPAITTIEISKEYLHFNAGHFTLFSATEREDLHGHTFYVTAELDSRVRGDGLAFDYNLVKSRLRTLCDHLDEKVLLPGLSPYLALVEEGEYLIARFDRERIPFLHRDVRVVEVRNVTVEELAPWFLERLLADEGVGSAQLERVTMRISSGAGQWAGATWKALPGIANECLPR